MEKLMDGVTFFAFWGGCVAALVLLSMQFTCRCGKLFGVDMLASVWGIPLLTRRKYRYNQLLTVRERYPYVGTREAYVECRTASYVLLGFLVVAYQHRTVELQMNDIVGAMTIGKQLDGEKLDKAFPPCLAFGGILVKGGRMVGLESLGDGPWSTLS